MMLRLRCCNAQQLMHNPNLLVFTIRHYTDKFEKIEDLQAVASDILQSNGTLLNSKEDKLPGDLHKVTVQISDYPEEPTTCCMSGCANCVWLEYAEKISAYYRDGGERAQIEINERVSDPNIKAFLLHELRTSAKKT